jgi:hypothetical protein
MRELAFEPLRATFGGAAESGTQVYRARVPGGWLVTIRSSYNNNPGIAFLPDPAHAWDGGSLPS